MGLFCCCSCFSFSFCNTTGWKSRDSVPKLVDQYIAGNLKVDEFISHTLPLAKINDAFTLLHEGKR